MVKVRELVSFFSGIFKGVYSPNNTFQLFAYQSFRHRLLVINSQLEVAAIRRG